MAALETVAIGLAPHSGWAAAVALAGPRRSPRVLVRTRIEMADPRDPESRQPYHAVEDVPVPEAAKRLARYMSVAERMAHAALQALEQDLAAHGCRVTSLGILESSGRKGGSLAATLASHALIHTADGDHFRDARPLRRSAAASRSRESARRTWESEPSLGSAVSRPRCKARSRSWAGRWALRGARIRRVPRCWPGSCSTRASAAGSALRWRTMRRGHGRQA